MLPIIGFYGLISCVFTFGKEAVHYVQPFFLTSSRLPIAGVVLLAWNAYINRHKKLHYSLSFFFLGLYAVALLTGDAFRFISMTIIPASHAALISATGPFVTAVLAHFLLDEYITKRKIYALVLGFLSVIPLVLQSFSQSSALPEGQWSLLIGYGTAFVSVFGFVLSSYSLKILVSRFHNPALFASGLGIILSGILGLILSLMYESWNPLPITNMSAAMPYLIALLVGHNIFGYAVWSYLVKRYPVSLISLGQLVLPFFTALLRYFFFGDTLTWKFAFSLVLLAGAFYLFYHETKKQMRAAKKSA